MRRWNKASTHRWLTSRRGFVSHLALVAFLFGGVLMLPNTLRSVDPSPQYLTPPTGGPAQGGYAGRAVVPHGELTGEEPGRQEAAPVAFFNHQVQEGETLSAIAERYGLDLNYLIWNNPEVGDPDLLIIGANLLIPGTEGIVYDVRLGDTISDIAALYEVDTADIVEFAPNNLQSPDNIIEGMVLVLPGAVPPPPPPPPEPPAPEPVAAPVPAAPEPQPAFAPVPAGVGVPAAVPSVGYIWPVGGPVNSYFGARWGGFHQGIDIGAGAGAAVSAAGSGQVVLAAYRDNGYGYYVVVRHDDGSQTLYAHLSEVWVAQGQYVGQGEGVGAVGCTGWCTGPHLHFEIRIGGAPVDPLWYLP